MFLITCQNVRIIPAVLLESFLDFIPPLRIFAMVERRKFSNKTETLLKHTLHGSALILQLDN
ncbi:hypothetical protein HMPREF1574_01039 [Gardnerella pickettii JCP7659]|nr:hypothetical protein HMPREF1574_01039 [Gardnerella pickettii JCP7659]